MLGVRERLLLNLRGDKMTLPVTFDDVRAAAERLRGVANRTPMLPSRAFNALTEREEFFKYESFQLPWLLNVKL